MLTQVRWPKPLVAALLAALIPVMTTGSGGAVLAEDNASGLPTVYHAAEQPQITALAKRTFTQMQNGKLDRGLFSPNAKAALSDDQLALAAQQLQALGTPSWSFVGEYHPPSKVPVPEVYLLKFAAVALRLEIALDQSGKITNFFLSPAPDDSPSN